MAKLLGPVAFSPETQLALDLARRAGAEILIPSMPMGKAPEIEEYKGERDLVTELDRQVERFLCRGIRAAFPDHLIYAEEEVREEGTGRETRWIIDPIDGTVNFIHGHPFYAISIAIERHGALEAGVVFAPYLNEIFYAERGRGAFLNSDRLAIRVTETATLIESVLASGFAYDRKAYPNETNWQRLAEKTRGLRRCGSAAMDLAYVAAGRYDGFWEIGLNPYDVAAGAVLVREAGGLVTDFAGGEDWLSGRSIVATNGKVHELVRAELDPWPPRT